MGGVKAQYPPDNPLFLELVGFRFLSLETTSPKLAQGPPGSMCVAGNEVMFPLHQSVQCVLGLSSQDMSRGMGTAQAGH